MNKKLVLGIVILVGIGLLASICYMCWPRRVRVILTNNTSKTLKDIRIAYTGGTIHLAELEPKASFEECINPSSESHLELDWVDSLGEKQFQKIDIYLEPNYSGDIEINIEPDNKVSWKDYSHIL